MQKTLLKRLERWLSHPDNSKTALAYELGYQSSATIDQWLRRQSIPKHRQKAVTTIIQQGGF